MAEDRYFFVHLMKTGGTVVYVALRRRFGSEAVYPGTEGSTGSFIDVRSLVDDWPELRDSVRVVSGHFPYWTVEQLEREMRTLTVLRDPVERVLSLLRTERTRRGGDETLAEVYETSMSGNPIYPNHMTRMLGTEAEEMPDGLLSPIDLGPAHVDRGVERIEAIDVVGFQDDLDAFGRSLNDTFGWDLPPFGRGNVSEPAPVAAGLRERIAADNALDMALYDRARATTR